MLLLVAMRFRTFSPSSTISVLIFGCILRIFSRAPLCAILVSLSVTLAPSRSARRHKNSFLHNYPPDLGLSYTRVTVTVSLIHSLDTANLNNFHSNKAKIDNFFFFLALLLWCDFSFFSHFFTRKHFFQLWNFVSTFFLFSDGQAKSGRLVESIFKRSFNYTHSLWLFSSHNPKCYTFTRLLIAETQLFFSLSCQSRLIDFFFRRQIFRKLWIRTVACTESVDCRWASRKSLTEFFT